MSCTIDGCDRAVYNATLGLCEAHNRRRLRGRLHDGRAIGEAPKGPPPSSDGYKRLHAALIAERGHASGYPCFIDRLFSDVSCGAAADEWALIAGDGASLAVAPDLLVSAEGLPFTFDTRRYLPLCRTHHRRLDVLQNLMRNGPDRVRLTLYHPSGDAVITMALNGAKVSRLLRDLGIDS